MSSKSAQQVVQECEKILKAHGMAGIVISMDDKEGYYGLTLAPDSLFQWNEDDTKVYFNANVSAKALDEEVENLKTLSGMLDYTQRAIQSLIASVKKATEEDDEPPEPKVNSSKDKRYDN